MTKSKTIFYLDDDSDDRYFFKNAAGSLGHKVMVFHNGDDLLKALRESKKKPDLLFLDVHMPVLNGEEMLNLLKKSDAYKHIPIVMISGAYPKKLVRHLLDAGAEHLMKKTPVNELRAAIAEVIENASESAQLSS